MIRQQSENAWISKSHNIAAIIPVKNKLIEWHSRSPPVRGRLDGLDKVRGFKRGIFAYI